MDAVEDITLPHQLTDTTCQNEDQQMDNIPADESRLSHPSDESVSYVLVTSISHLQDSDVQNTDHSTIMRSSEDPCSSSQQMTRETTPYSPICAHNDISNSNNNNNNSIPTNGKSEALTQIRPLEENSDMTIALRGLLIVEENPSPGGSDISQQEQQQEDEDPREESNDRGTPLTCDDLGIITARPKSVDFAIYSKRLDSFTIEWPNPHKEPSDLAKAGYFYTGDEDCVRCFYCGGGLRNWEPEDDAWVEHARHFPKCVFLLHEVGKDFIDTVLAISREKDKIAHEDVIQKMHDSNTTFSNQCDERAVENDPAVMSLIDNGFDKGEIIRLAQEIRESGELLSSRELYNAAKERNIVKTECRASINDQGMDAMDGICCRINDPAIDATDCPDSDNDKETIEALREENQKFRWQTTCKICMDLEVAVAFLPCGHLVSCSQCSCALTMCPSCRAGIKGTVKIVLDHH